jgi:P-type Mg2+ transporter
MLTLILPFTPVGGLFGFSALSVSFLMPIGIIVMGYIISAEIAKSIFYKGMK